MFQEHPFVVWGAQCRCGGEVSILQNSFHPWSSTDFIVKAWCPVCGRAVEIDQSRASEFYSRKILSYFTDVSGEVLDLGCGGGFLTEFVAGKDDVSRVCAIDSDPACEGSIGAINDPERKIRFERMDAGKIGRRFASDSVDYLVHRDVFMFIDDPGLYFDDVTRIVRRGIRHMAWYVKGNARMKNAVAPDEIVAELQRRGWEAGIEYLDWYKCGYFVRAQKK